MCVRYNICVHTYVLLDTQSYVHKLPSVNQRSDDSTIREAISFSEGSRICCIRVH